MEINELYELQKNIAALNVYAQAINASVQKLTNPDESEERTPVIQAYNAIKQSIHLFNPCHNLQHKIYDKDIRNCIDAFTKSMNIIKQKLAVENDFDFNACNKIIMACLNEYSLKLSSLTSVFLQNLDLLCTVLNRDDLKEEVVAMFVQKPEDLIAV